MDESKINYKYLVNKAKKRWQLYIAKICTFPVILMMWVVNIYMGLALLFGLMAIFLFFYSLFDNSEFNPLTIFLAYVPFFIVVLIVFIFSKVGFLKNIRTGILFFTCNFIIYALPLSYGVYKLRHYQLESYLQRIEYDRCNDRYCQALIDAYSKRHALFNVWVSNVNEYNNHVGHEWQIFNYINSKQIESNSLYIELSEGDTIEISTTVVEFDAHSDYGQKTTSFKIPWSALVEERNLLSHEVYVMERNGRFAGNISIWKCTYFIERCAEKRVRHKRDIYVPEDSIKKYFFTFKNIYKAKYNPDDKPWEKNKTDIDNRIISSSWDFDFSTRHFHDEESEYTINRNIWR